MRRARQRPVFDREDHFDSASRTVRWVILGLVMVSVPPHTTYSLIILTLVAVMSIYNALRYSQALRRRGIFRSRTIELAIDQLFITMLIALTGGLASPFYALFFLVILAAIASFGIAGFAFSLAIQSLLTIALIKWPTPPTPDDPFGLVIIKLALLILFALVAEQTVRNRQEDYLFSGQISQRAETERQRLLSLINSLSHGVLALNAHGKVYLYNAAALELLNTNKDITGQSLESLLPLHDHHSRKIDILKQVEDNGRTINRQDLHFKASDDSNIILDITVTPVHSFGYEPAGGGGGYMAIFRDITKEKSLDEERDEFISVTSHELRTPLAIAEANLSTALLPNYAHIDPKAKTLINQAHENIIFLSALIEDLATLSRAERNDLKLKLEIIDAAALAGDLARDYTPQAAAKHLQLKLNVGEDLPAVVTSLAELREILQNFLTNAIKYTGSGSITLSVQRAGSGVEFAVSDTGIGLSASDKKKIFEKFFRSEDYRTRATGGTGLGLYITHKLAEKLGAKINFDSRLNHGTTFRVIVPPNLSGEAESD